MNRKLLTVQLMTVILVALLSVFINFLTNDVNIINSLSANEIGTKKLFGIVAVITIILIVLEYIKFRDSKPESKNSQQISQVNKKTYTELGQEEDKSYALKSLLLLGFIILAGFLYKSYTSVEKARTGIFYPSNKIANKISKGKESTLFSNTQIIKETLSVTVKGAEIFNRRLALNLTVSSRKDSYFSIPKFEDKDSITISDDNKSSFIYNKFELEEDGRLVGSIFTLKKEVAKDVKLVICNYNGTTNLETVNFLVTDAFEKNNIYELTFNNIEVSFITPYKSEVQCN